MSKTTQTTTVNVLTYAAIDAMTVNELKAECKANGIHGYSRLNKLALQGLLYDVADEQVKAQCIDNIEWSEQMQEKLAEVCDCGTTENEAIKSVAIYAEAIEAPTVTITHERQHIDGIGAFVYIDVDGTYAYQDMCGYRTYKTLRGLNKYVQGEAKMANRKAPEIVEATEATTQQVAADAAKQPSKSVSAPEATGYTKAEECERVAIITNGEGRTVCVTSLDQFEIDLRFMGITDTSDYGLIPQTENEALRDAIVAKFEAMRATVDPTTAGRITTFDTMADAIEGMDNLIAWEYEDCPDDYDLRAIAEAVTCERCGKLAVLPTYDELSDQFDASALWMVVESHYTGDDDPEPTDPTDPATDADEATDEAEGFDATGIPTESEVFAARTALDLADAGALMVNLDRARAIVEADEMRRMPDISELPQLPDVPAVADEGDAIIDLGGEIGDAGEARTWLAESIAAAIEAERTGADIDALAWDTFKDAMDHHRLTIWERAAFGTADTLDGDPDQILTDQKREVLRATRILADACPYGCAEVRDEIEAEMDMICAWEEVICGLGDDGFDLTTESVIRRLREWEG